MMMSPKTSWCKNRMTVQQKLSTASRRCAEIMLIHSRYCPISRENRVLPMAKVLVLDS
ncbi:hypothetical protein TELCIR_10436 [Teladorsagia circumcincta]|uniref:Uncharacterized protein n=1 Tax=Teladorsagia circumcincta TaxID=45464 RepID=A0A2G9UCB0_TELCI|nr:hypothetical protein TELCIR_10436 [Teladorsagia circumcincta]